jgi:hypothetical protein
MALNVLFRDELACAERFSQCSGWMLIGAALMGGKGEPLTYFPSFVFL